MQSNTSQGPVRESDSANTEITVRNTVAYRNIPRRSGRIAAAATAIIGLLLFTTLAATKESAPPRASMSMPSGTALMEHPEPLPGNGDGIDYVVWVDEDAGARGLLLNCSPGTRLDTENIAAMARSIYRDIHGDSFSQITIAWHARNSASRDEPLAVSYMTKGKTAHRVLR